MQHGTSLYSIPFLRDDKVLNLRKGKRVDKMEKEKEQQGEDGVPCFGSRLNARMQIAHRSVW
jgi:hypothetical protein